MLKRNLSLNVVLVLVMLISTISFALAEDTDGDGLDDTWELRYFGNRTLSGNSDPDWDTLYNSIEYKLGSSPINNDSDSDSWSDTIEYLYSTNLTEATSFPRDSLVNISIINPKFGVSAAAPFDLKIKTSNQSDCKYSTSSSERYDTIDSADQKFSTVDGISHQILNFPLSTSFDTAIYVYCKTKTGYANDLFPKEFLLSIDSSEPRLLVARSDPAKVIEKLEVNLVAETDDKTVCRFPIVGTNLSDLKSLFSDAKIDDFKTKNELFLSKNTKVKIEDNRRYTFVVACMNRAEMPAIGQITFDVNLSVQNIITEKRPSGFLRSTKSEFRVTTNKDATCKYGEGYLYTFPQGAKKDHFIPRDNLTEGQHSIPIMCVFSDAMVIEDFLSFTVDVAAPTISNISSKAETCMNNFLSVDYFSLDKDILNYTVKLYDYKNTLMYAGSTGLSRIELGNLTLERGQKYTWEVFASDLAGNNGTAKRSQGTTVLPEDSEICMVNKAPYMAIDKKLTPQGIKIDLICKDDDVGGSCVSTYYSIVDSLTNSSCKACGSCSYTRYLGTSSILAKEDTVVCYNITDNKKKNIEGNFLVKYSDCTKNESCCVEKEGQICIGANCSLITELDCKTDTLDLDGDGMIDNAEKACGLSPKNKEDALLDYDNDTLKNKDECINHKTDINKKDTDGDGFDDNVELVQGTSPLDKSSFPIDPDKDTDEDGIIDTKEKECGLDPENKDDASDDEDGDGLSNYRECVKYSTMLDRKDSDEDGYEDGIEVEKETDPTDRTSFPKSHVLQIILFCLGIIAIGGSAFIFMKNGLPDFGSSNKISFGKPMQGIQKTGSPMPQNQKAGGFTLPIKTGGFSFSGLKKPLMDFGRAKKELGAESKNIAAGNNPYVQSSQAQQYNPNNDKLDMEIKKKREELKFKKMTTVFDSFGEEGTKRAEQEGNLPPSAAAGKEKTREDYLKDKVFNRLDNISNEDAFEEIEMMKKRKKNE